MTPPPSAELRGTPGPSETDPRQPRVLISQRFFPEAVRLLSEKCQVTALRAPAPLGENALIRKARQAEGLISFLSDRITSKLMAALPKLRIISNVAVGYNNIDMAAATSRGIFVCNTPDVLTDATADLTWALILAAVRQVPAADRYVRQGRFRSWQLGLFLGMDLPGQTLGIIGLGRIGLAVARRAKAFGLQILYHNPQPKPAAAQEVGASFCALDDLLRRSDIISLHCRLDSSTHHLIGKRQLSLMKPCAYLINTSRGPVVDEKALVEALKSKKIAGAGLDVYEHEPRLAPGLTRLPNAVLLPHIASATTQTRMKMAMAAAQNVVAFFSGKLPPPNCLNPKALSAKLTP